MSVESLDRALGQAASTLLDSSTIISFHTSSDDSHRLAEHLLARVAASDDPLAGYFCAVSAAELLVRPLRAGARPAALMTSWLREFPNLHALDVTFDVALQAATLRAISGIRTPDALIVASGLLAGCEAIVTNDERWRDRLRPLFPEFTWVYLYDHLR